jgi:hypothetical protein
LVFGYFDLLIYFYLFIKEIILFIILFYFILFYFILFYFDFKIEIEIAQGVGRKSHIGGRALESAVVLHVRSNILPCMLSFITSG